MCELSYNPFFPLGPQERWEVMVSVGTPGEDDGIWYWTAPTPQQALQHALADVAGHLDVPPAAAGQVGCRPTSRPGGGVVAVVTAFDP